jgi:hypothetical protein
LIAGLVGALGAIGLSYALARYVLDVPWQLAPVTTAAGVGLTAGSSRWWAWWRTWTSCGGSR